MASVPRKLHVYFDLDGVLADFDGGVRALGLPTEGYVDFSQIYRRCPCFFADLCVLREGLELWKEMQIRVRSGELTVSVLTGLPRGGWALEQKEEWCIKHLGKMISLKA